MLKKSVELIKNHHHPMISMEISKSITKLKARKNMML